MQLEVGSILEGKVTGITKFGAFIELPVGKTGMVHISEVASSYVKEISDYLSLNQTVRVKVIGITPEGKVSLSIKQVDPSPAAPPQPFAHRDRNDRSNSKPSFNGGQGAPYRKPQSRRPFREVSYGFDRRKPISNETMSFEDMMSKFKQTSEDKMSDLKKYTDVKRGTSRGRK